jgi:hypothetical protein
MVFKISGSSVQFFRRMMMIDWLVPGLPLIVSPFNSCVNFPAPARNDERRLNFSFNDASSYPPFAGKKDGTNPVSSSANKEIVPSSLVKQYRTRSVKKVQSSQDRSRP